MQRPQEQKHCSKQSLQRTELTQPFPLPLSHSRPIVKLCLKIQFYLCGAGTALIQRSAAQSHRHRILHEHFYSSFSSTQYFHNQLTHKGLSFVVSCCLLQLHSSTSLLQAPFRVTNCAPIFQAPFRGTNCAPILLAQRNTRKLLPGDSQAVTSVIQVFCTQTNAKFKEWDLNLRFILVQICHNPAEGGQPLFPRSLRACVGIPDVEILRYNKDTSWPPCKSHTHKEFTSQECLLWWQSSLLLPDSYLEV